MPRLFIAISLPETVKDQLLDLIRPIPGARWMDEERLHLTLRFVGDVDGGQYLDLRRALGTLHNEPFTLTPKDVGHFPPRGEPRILWAGIESNDILMRLQRKVDHIVCGLGHGKDKRKFMPHITLAKMKNTPAQKVGQFIMENSLFQADSFPVGEFHLYSSQLNGEGPIYTLEETYQLAPEAEVRE